MAKKKKHPEHVNLERWLISYADFITLLFATFVVLYALSQVDIKDFKSLEDSIKQAFAAPSLMQGSQGVMGSSESLFDTSQADSMITPLMMEYMSQKYEDQSMDEMEKEINDKVKEDDLTGIEVSKNDLGIVIKLQDDYLFKSGSAELTPGAKVKLDKVGAIIAKKFILHNIRIEGHTDNQPLHTAMFPSNWELSSARSSAIIRYFISQFAFMPSIFTAVGFADTRPVVSNNSPSGKSKNRRVEILILKNRFKAQESATNDIMKMSKHDQETMQAKRIGAINRIQALYNEANSTSDLEKRAEENAAVLNQVYNKEVKRLFRQTQAFDNASKSKLTGQGEWLRPPAKVEDIKVFEKK